MALGGGKIFITYSNGASVRTAHSLDEGDTWTLDEPGVPGPRPVMGGGFLVATSERILLLSRAYLYESQDAGVTWTWRPLAIPNVLNVGFLAVSEWTGDLRGLRQAGDASGRRIGPRALERFRITWPAENVVPVFQPSATWAGVGMAIATDGASRTLLLVLFDPSSERLRVVRSIDDGATWQLAGR